MPAWILAIDFGTSYTVAAAKVEGRVPEIVEIAGERRMPSVVMVAPDGEIHVGRTAEDLSVTHPGGTLRALKNRLGDQTPAILAGRPHQVVTLVAAVLREVSEQVNSQMGEPPTAVHLTHPATWNQPRINRLVEAAAKAGLENPVLVPEPVAAALSYAADVGLAAGRPVAVYDLGGGTFDSAVVAARDGGLIVVGRPGGDQHIGGELFDELVVNHIGSTLDPDAWEAIQVGDDPLWRQVGASLRNEARRGKEALSSHPYVNILVPLPAGLSQVRLTRDEFSLMVRPYIAETIVTFGRCLAEAGVEAEDLAGISMVGGASRSPIVVDMVRAAFPDVVLSRRGDPKATVAAGATLAEPPSATAPALWRSQVTKPASPGTARQPLRLAPPPLSDPPIAPQSTPPTPTSLRLPTPSPAPLPPVSLPTPLPADPVPIVPAAIPAGARAPRPGGASTIAIPVMPRPLVTNRSTKRSRRPSSIIAFIVAAGFVIVPTWLAIRDHRQPRRTSTASSVQSTVGSVGTADTSDTGVVDTGVVDTGVVDTGVVDTAITDVATPVTADSVTADSGTVTSPSTDASVEDGQGVATGTLIHRLEGHSAEISTMAFSPDGTQLVTAGQDNLVIVWDVASGKPLGQLVGPDETVYAVDYSPDGSRIATAGADSTMLLWDAATGDLLHTFSGHSEVVYTVAFSPDGNTVLTASQDGTARLWDIPTLAESSTLVGSTEGVYFAAFSPDGERVIAGGQDDIVRVWNVAAPDDPLAFSGHIADVKKGLFSPDQTLVMSGSDDGTTKVWDSESGELIYDIAVGEAVQTVSFSHDGTRAVMGDSAGTVKLWDLATNRSLGDLSGHTGSVWTAEFSPKDRAVLTASLDGTARIFGVVGRPGDPQFGAQVAELSSGPALNGAIFSPDGSVVAIADQEGVVTIIGG